MSAGKPSASAGARPAGRGKPVVAIVGRPNVGKSTLFNRLIGGRKAIVEDLPGTTRDRLYGEVEWGRHSFTLIDTGGLEPSAEEGYLPLIRRQVETALAEADLVLFLVDASEGATATDIEIAEELRQAPKPVLLLANKADNDARRSSAVEFYALGLGDPIPISAYHDLGLGELRDRLDELLPPAGVEAPPEMLRLAVVGRPNVGKSMLVNAILGQERVIVSEEPGTTRDAVDTPFTYREKRVLLIDTAGIRRPGRVGRGLEKYSVMRAREAIGRCDVGIVLLDATQGVAAQDLHIAGYVAEAYKGLIIAINKWDLMEDTEEQRQGFANRALRRLRFAPWAPLAFVSAKTGLNLDGLLELALEVGETRSIRLPTAEVNAAVREMVSARPPPSKGRRFLHVLYATQA
ncbi:MAG: ribosome biogenesis GTPase Der, partial [Chloroflexi bacterium]|nr:ribosome biogenesis GTPase Der [Chloroflexota bacterium]